MPAPFMQLGICVIMIAVAKHLLLQFSRLMFGLPDPYPAVNRLMDAGRPAVIYFTIRVVSNSGRQRFVL